MSDINELFSRDPMKMTTEDIDKIIEEMRKKRHLFLAGPVKEKKAKAAPAPKTLTAKAASNLELDLDL